MKKRGQKKREKVRRRNEGGGRSQSKNADHSKAANEGALLEVLVNAGRRKTQTRRRVGV